MLKKTWGHFKVLTSLPPHSITALPATHRNFPILLVRLNSSLLAVSKFGLSPYSRSASALVHLCFWSHPLLDLIFLVSFHFYLCLQLLHFSSVYSQLPFDADPTCISQFFSHLCHIWALQEHIQWSPFPYFCSFLCLLRSGFHLLLLLKLLLLMSPSFYWHSAQLLNPLE